MVKKRKSALLSAEARKNTDKQTECDTTMIYVTPLNVCVCVLCVCAPLPSQSCLIKPVAWRDQSNYSLPHNTFWTLGQIRCAASNVTHLSWQLNIHYPSVPVLMGFLFSEIKTASYSHITLQKSLLCFYGA